MSCVAHRRAQPLEDRSWEIEVLVFSAVGMATQGMYELAADIAQQAASHTKDGASPTSQAWTLYALAESVHHDDPELAGEFLSRAASLAREVGNEWVLGLAQVSLARQWRRTGLHADAAVALLDDLARWSWAGNWSEQWRTVREMARLCVELGRDDAITPFAAVEGEVSVIPTSRNETAEIIALRRDLVARLGEGLFEKLARRGRLLASVTPDEIVDHARHALRSVLAQVRHWRAA